MTAPTPNDFAERLAVINERIAAAGGDDVTLVAVSKGFGADAIGAAIAGGLSVFGESYAQELLQKAGAFDGVACHFIGGLQRNKVRRVADVVDLWQSVDRPELAREIAKRAPGAAVLLQVDISGEATKGGCAPGALDDLLDVATEAGLEVRGLMGIALHANPSEAAPGFALLRRLADERDLAEVSMGMSADLEVAVEHGSTMVRVGSALFGARPASR